MPMQAQHNTGTAVGTAAGTILSLFASIHTDDIVKTSILALTGAVVSFTASLILRWISRRVARKQ
ncbi:MAG TPA: hypothetical protein VGK59_15065 [Ohtaekwangia sp.]